MGVHPYGGASINMVIAYHSCIAVHTDIGKGIWNTIGYWYICTWVMRTGLVGVFGYCLILSSNMEAFINSYQWMDWFFIFCLSCLNHSTAWVSSSRRGKPLFAAARCRCHCERWPGRESSQGEFTAIFSWVNSMVLIAWWDVVAICSYDIYDNYMNFSYDWP